MNKPQWLKVLNLVLFISLLVQALTGLVLFFSLFVTQIDVFIVIHKYNGLFLILLVGLHLWFNWSWIKINFFKKTSRP